MVLQKLLITEKVIKYYDRIRLFTAILIFTKEIDGEKETPGLAVYVISHGAGHRGKEKGTECLFVRHLSFDNFLEMM